MVYSFRTVDNENFYRPQTELMNHYESLEQYFLENPVSSVYEAITKIEELTGHSTKKIPSQGVSTKNWCAAQKDGCYSRQC